MSRKKIASVLNQVGNVAAAAAALFVGYQIMKDSPGPAGFVTLGLCALAYTALLVWSVRSRKTHRNGNSAR